MTPHHLLHKVSNCEVKWIGQVSLFSALHRHNYAVHGKKFKEEKICGCTQNPR